MFEVSIDPAHRKTWRALQNRALAVQSIQKGIKHGFYFYGKYLVRKAQDSIMYEAKTGQIYRLFGNRAKLAGKSIHQASAPGEAPANLYGLLKRSVTYVNKGDQLEWGYGSEAEYGLYLEKGTKKIKPRPNILRHSNESSAVAEVEFNKTISHAIYKWLK